MERMVTRSMNRGGSSRQSPVAEPAEERPCYRLVHSTREVFTEDRAKAVDLLASLPGARLFVLPDSDSSPAGH